MPIVDAHGCYNLLGSRGGVYLGRTAFNTLEFRSIFTII